MSSLYIDPTALVLPGGDPATPDAQLAPGVAGALAHLAEAGFDVVVLGALSPYAGLPAGVAHEAAVPEQLSPGEWFVTGEPYPARGLPKGGKTAFVGPRRVAGRLPLPRFDLEARDMSAAAMEILTRQVVA